MKMKNWLGFVLAVALISSALFLQWFEHLKPCPLCILQRIAFMIIALLFFIFALLPARIWLMRLQGLLFIITAGGGLSVAARQVYLQHLPPGQAPSCGPGLSYLFDTLPWHQAFAMILQGSGECAIVDWRFLGLSMAAWSALWLLFFLICGVLMLCKKTL